MGAFWLLLYWKIFIGKIILSIILRNRLIIFQKMFEKSKTDHEMGMLKFSILFVKCFIFGFISYILQEVTKIYDFRLLKEHYFHIPSMLICTNVKKEILNSTISPNGF